MIEGYREGANISIMNTFYQRPKRDEKTGKYGDDGI